MVPQRLLAISTKLRHHRHWIWF